jgi:hypothetical protein
MQTGRMSVLILGISFIPAMSLFGLLACTPCQTLASPSLRD